MRAVGYVNSGALRSTEVDVPDTVEEQEKRIRAYALEIGWEVTAVYSDVDGGMDGYRRLSKDGAKRLFDGVIVDSAFLSGGNISYAHELLQKVFLPAGIHFAIVEDSYNSIGKTMQEAEEYFNGKKMRRLLVAAWKKRSEKGLKGALTKRQHRYGYRLSEDCTELVVDEEAAAVVKDIFRMYTGGMNYKEITAKLNADGIMSPYRYKIELFGGEWDGRMGEKWDWKVVRRIIRNPIYDGRAVRMVDGEDRGLEVPRLIPKETYARAQELANVKSREISWQTKGMNALSGYIRDGATGKKLMCIYSGREKDMVYTLMKDSRHLRKKDPYIPYRTVMDAICEALRRERMQADQVERILGEGNARAYMEEAISGYREQMRECVRKIDAAYEKRMAEHADGIGLRDGGTDVGHDLGAFMEYEEEVRKIMEDADKIEMTYSRKNPWLALYGGIEVPEELGRPHVKKWIASVTVTDFREVTVELREQGWKKRLPKGWLEPDGAFWKCAGHGADTVPAEEAAGKPQR